MGLTMKTRSLESKRPLKGKIYGHYTRQYNESQMDEDRCTLHRAAEWIRTILAIALIHSPTHHRSILA